MPMMYGNSWLWSLFAINGKGRGAKELVFLSGTLYDASNNKPVAVYTGDYFKSADDGAGSTTESPTVIFSPLPWATLTETLPGGNRWCLQLPSSTQITTSPTC